MLARSSAAHLFALSDKYIVKLVWRKHFLSNLILKSTLLLIEWSHGWKMGSLEWHSGSTGSVLLR